MKIRVISEFYDKYHTSTLYKVGTVCDFDDTRAQDIISKHLGEKVEETPKKVEKPAEKKADEVSESVKEAETPVEEPAKAKGRPRKEKAE